MASGLSVQTCLLLSRLFECGPLARYGTRNAQQVATRESCIEDRVGMLGLYEQLFAPFGDWQGRRP